jgi:hypothetical protein
MGYFFAQQHRIANLVAVMIFLVSTTLFLRSHTTLTESLIDDAFITFRYSANLAHGYGLVYNVDERVWGTTTPGFALILGVIGALTDPQNIPTAARVLNTVLMLVAGLAAALTVWRLLGNLLAASLIFALILLGPDAHYSSLAGMESPLFLALISLAFLTLASQRDHLAAVIVSSTILVRPEAVFLIGLLTLHWTWRWRFSPLPRLSTGQWAARLTLLLVPALVFFMIGWLYYGTPIPQTIIAKRAGLYPVKLTYTLNEVFERIGTRLMFLPEPIGISNTSKLAIVKFAVVVALLLTTFSASTVYLWRKANVLWVIPTFTLMMIGLFATSQTNLFEHYFAFYEPLLLVCWWLGLYIALRWIVARMPQTRLVNYLAAPVTAAALVPTLLLFPYRDTLQGRYSVIEPYQARLIAYRNLARQLAPLLPDGTVVLMPEIGELGFYMPDTYVLDSGGLVSKEAIVYFPVAPEQRIGASTGAIPPEMVKTYLPDMIITLDVFGDKGILDDPWFWEHYTSVVTIKGDWLPWNSEVLYVLSRNDFVAGMRLANRIDTAVYPSPKP